MTRHRHRPPAWLRDTGASLLTLLASAGTGAAVTSPEAVSTPIDNVTEIRRLLLERDRSGAASAQNAPFAPLAQWANWNNWNNWKNWKNWKNS
jgi:hypothetical protein